MSDEPVEPTPEPTPEPEPGEDLTEEGTVIEPSDHAATVYDTDGDYTGVLGYGHYTAVPA
jgi:hypothetical protein